MITTFTKELPFILDVPITKGKVALLGDQTHCSNYAARHHKHKNYTNLDDALTLTNNLQTNEYVSCELYYAGETIELNSIKAGTNTLVIVSDDYDYVASLYGELIDSHPTLILQHVLAKDSSGITYYNQMLASTDFMVIRELERKFLSDSALSIERERYREIIDTEITNYTEGR